MRAVLVKPGPHFAVEDVAQGWKRALEALGVGTREFDLGGRMGYHETALKGIGYADANAKTCSRLAAESLRSLCFDWWPDVVLVVSGFFIPPDTYDIIRNRGMKIAVLLTESPYEDDNQYAIAAAADFAVVNDPTNLETFRQHQPNTIYLPHAYDPAIHHPQPAQERAASDFCFVGTGYPSRMEFFEQVDFDGIDAAFAGNWCNLPADSQIRKFMAHDLDVCCANDETAVLYASTKASANIYRTEAQRPELSEGWAMNPREVELAAIGTFYLTERRGENREVLPMLPWFDGPGDFGDKLRWWLAHPDWMRDAATLARAAIADRTFINHARQLLASIT